MGKHLKRSHIREAAFLLIFEKLFRDDSCDEIIESASEADEFDFNDEVKRLLTRRLGSLTASSANTAKRERSTVSER